jgi:glutamate 5-kinase
VEKHGKSLLPIGVISVDGSFGKGDLISICDGGGIEFARGLTNYSSADAERLRGLNSDQIARAVGKLPYVELIHRDNLAIVG